jgi:hypothetical protein
MAESAIVMLSHPRFPDAKPMGVHREAVDKFVADGWKVIDEGTPDPPADESRTETPPKSKSRRETSKE